MWGISKRSYKNGHQYGLDVHNGAALVIARRAFKFNDKVPNILQDKLLNQEEKNKFKKQNNWKQWSVIVKKIKTKGGEKPGFGLDIGSSHLLGGE